jgi:transposase InsO family protein
MVELASEYGRYGYRRVGALLGAEGFRVNHKRIERLWRREGWKVPQKQPKRKRLWLNDGSCIRLRPAYPDHVWSYDIVKDRTSDGRALRLLTIIDEYSRECLAIDVGRQMTSDDVLDRLVQLFVERGAPAYLRSADWRWHQCLPNTDAYDGPQPHWVAVLQGRVPLIDTAGLALATMLISDGIYLSQSLGREVTAADIEKQSKSTAVKV